MDKITMEQAHELLKVADKRFVVSERIRKTVIKHWREAGLIEEEKKGTIKYIDNDKKGILKEFITKVSKQKDLDPEINDMINKHFWDLIEKVDYEKEAERFYREGDLNYTFPTQDRIDKYREACMSFKKAIHQLKEKHKKEIEQLKQENKQ